jgi:hypothetical protein
LTFAGLVDLLNLYEEVIVDGIEVLFLIFGLITLAWGGFVILRVSLSCWAERSTRTFFKDIWSAMAGLWIVIIPLMVLSLPIFLLLTVAIALSGERASAHSTQSQPAPSIRRPPPIRRE